MTFSTSPEQLNVSNLGPLFNMLLQGFVRPVLFSFIISIIGSGTTHISQLYP